MSIRQQAAGSQIEPGYRKLVAWKRADKLASMSFHVARILAREEAWLASQLKRAELSAPLNIVEGHSRGTIRDFLRFLENASASLAEVEYLVYFIIENEILDTPEVRALEPARNEAAKVLNGLMKSLHKKLKDGNGWQRNLMQEEPAIYLANGYEAE